MSYLRLFIELHREDTGSGCGQARVELQDRPGRVDCKVRCGMMGLPAGQTYEMALVCEQGGGYKEYPLGQFTTSLRGQAGPMFRGSFAAEPGQLPVTDFKAMVARSLKGTPGAFMGGQRIVGFRGEPLLIPDVWEEPVQVSVPAEMEAEQKVEETPEEPVAAAVEEVMAVTEAVEEADGELSENVEAELPEEITEEPAAVETDGSMVDGTSMETDAVPVNELERPRLHQGFAPSALYVINDLSQVDAVCGEAAKRAFGRYRHLALMQKDDVSYIGMPCRYRSSQRMELAAEGYTEFYVPRGGEPNYGEFGYWVKRL